MLTNFEKILLAIVSFAGVIIAFVIAAFALLASGLFNFIFGNGNGVSSFVAPFAFFAVFYVILFASLYLVSSKLALVTKSEFELGGAPSEIIEEIRQGFVPLRNWKIVNQTPSMLKMKTRASFTSWGEIVTIDATASSSSKGSSHVVIQSHPRFRLSDWGLSEQNVNVLAGYLVAYFYSGREARSTN